MREEQNSKQRKLCGFSLVELSVVLVILGMIMSLGIKLLPELTERAGLTNTAVTLEQAKEIVIGYAISNSEMPCPDDPAAADGIGDCGGPLPGTAARMTGLLPYLDLGLSAPLVDSANRPIRYSVFRMYDRASPQGFPLPPPSQQRPLRKIYDLAEINDISSPEAKEINAGYLDTHPIPVLDTFVGGLGNDCRTSSPTICGPSNDDNLFYPADNTELGIIERTDLCQSLVNADNDNPNVEDEDKVQTGSSFNVEYRVFDYPSELFTSVSTASGGPASDPYNASGCATANGQLPSDFSNQAFVLISSGAGDADVDGDLFDGENAIAPINLFNGVNGNTNCFESPSRGRTAIYDDVVLAVSFNELRARLCR